MNNATILQSIALDLKRVAIGYNAGSFKMADRFLEEAIKRKMQLNMQMLSDSVKKVVIMIEEIGKSSNYHYRADRALTYSTILLSLVKLH
jgi:hypothetical protein